MKSRKGLKVACLFPRPKAVTDSSDWASDSKSGPFGIETKPFLSSSEYLDLGDGEESYYEDLILEF